MVGIVHIASRIRTHVILALAVLGAQTAAAQTVTDGDTLKQGGVTYRLWGIDAPEASRPALMDGPQAAWPRPDYKL